MLQIHTTYFNYRDRSKKNIPVVFHFLFGAGTETGNQNTVGIPVRLKIIDFGVA